MTREVAELEAQLSRLDDKIDQLHIAMVAASEDFVALNDLQRDLDVLFLEKEVAEEQWLEKSEALGE